MSGTAYSADYLMDEILKETAFMDRSAGGVTFCGGEPLLHPDMLLELLRRCGEEDIHRVVDTTLYARPEIVTEVMHNCEMFLVDLKQMDSEKHRRFCGTPNERILSILKMNLKRG
jgi:pyruvate formate lyase activating enzyme